MNYVDLNNKFRQQFNLKPINEPYQELELHKNRIMNMFEILLEGSCYNIKIIENTSIVNKSFHSKIYIDKDKIYKHFGLKGKNYNNLDLYDFIEIFLFQPIKYNQMEILQNLASKLNQRENFVKYEITDMLYRLKFLLNQGSYVTLIDDQYPLSRYNYVKNIQKKLIEIFNQSSISILPIFNDLDMQANIFDDTLYYKGSEIDFAHKGDMILDNALILDTVNILSNNSRTLYLEAHDCYIKGKNKDALDKLRKSIEAWLNFKLGMNKRSLKNIKRGDIEKKLAKRSDQNEPEKQKYYNSVLNILYQYENLTNDVKHQNNESKEVSKPFLEFMIYQTGSLIRYFDGILGM